MFNSGKKRGKAFRVFSVCALCFFSLSFVFPKDSLAYRSRDGGGDIVEFDFGKWAAGTAVGMVSSALGSSLVSGLGSAFSSNPNVTFLGSFTDSLGLNGFMETNPPSGLPDSLAIARPTWLDTWGTNLVNSSAVGQVQNAVGMMGSYYGWDPRSTIFISSIAGGVLGGGLSPGHFGSSLGSGLGVAQSLNGSIGAFEGMGIGLFEGTVGGAILMSAADKKGHIDPLMGNLANLTGSFVTGSLVGGLTGPTDGFSFANIGDFNLAGAGQSGMRVVLRSIPSAGLSMGVQSITRSMDKQDATIVKNAFSGAYYLVNAPTGRLVDNEMMPSIFGKKSEIPITNTTTVPPPLQKASDPSPQIPLAQIPSQTNWDRSYRNRQ